MKVFSSPQSAIEWMETACESPINNNRVHGGFSFLAAGRLGMTEKFTVGNGLISRAAEWRNRFERRAA